MIETIRELIDLLSDINDVAQAAVQTMSSGETAVDAGTAVVQTVKEAEDASSFVDDLVLDGEAILEPGADLPPTAEEIGPLYRLLEASQPTIHGVKTDLNGVVIALAPVAAFLALVGPIVRRRRRQSESLAASVQRASSVSTQLQRRYTDETLPPAIAREVQALNAALGPIRGELRSAKKALASIDGKMRRLEILETIARKLRPVHDILRSALGALKPVRKTLRKIEAPLRKAKKMYDRWKGWALNKIKKALADAGFSPKKLEAFSRQLQSEIKSLLRRAASPVEELKKHVTRAVPKLPLDAAQQEIQRVDRQLTRKLDPVLPLLQRFEKVAGQKAGITASPRRRALSAPRRSRSRRSGDRSSAAA